MNGALKIGQSARAMMRLIICMLQRKHDGRFDAHMTSGRSKATKNNAEIATTAARREEYGNGMGNISRCRIWHILYVYRGWIFNEAWRRPT
jgi:hypothetical protein